MIHGVVRGPDSFTCADEPRLKGLEVVSPIRVFFDRRSGELRAAFVHADGEPEERPLDLCTGCLEALLRAHLPYPGVIVEGGQP